MTESQVNLLHWFRQHAASQIVLGNQKRAARVIEGAVEFARRNTTEDDENAGEFFEILVTAAGRHLHAGENEEAANLYREALALTERPQVNIETLVLAEAQQHLGVALDREGNDAEAVENFEQALAAMLSVDPQPVESIANLSNNLGMLWRNLSDYPKAEKHYQDSLEIFNDLGQSHALDAATVCNNLGTLYWAWRQPAMARDFHLQALKIRREHLPDTHPDVGQTACNLAAVYHDLGDFEKASFNYERALKILRPNVKADPETYEIVASNYADLLDEHNQSARATKLRTQTAKRIAKLKGGAKSNQSAA